jgi:hypothetical protein
MRKKGRIQLTLERTYEGFLELPVPVVLVVLWVLGLVIVGSLALALYLYGSALVRMVLGP